MATSQAQRQHKQLKDDDDVTEGTGAAAAAPARGSALPRTRHDTKERDNTKRDGTARHKAAQHPSPTTPKLPTRQNLHPSRQSHTQPANPHRRGKPRSSSLVRHHSGMLVSHPRRRPTTNVTAKWLQRGHQRHKGTRARADTQFHTIPATPRLQTITPRMRSHTRDATTTLQLSQA
jgi:hypothetical protein